MWNSSKRGSNVCLCTGLRIEKSMETSKPWLDHVPSNDEPSLRNLSARYQKFGSDFCLSRWRDKTSAGYKCNFHSEPSSALLPVSVRSIESVFGSENLLSAEPNGTVENNKRGEREDTGRVLFFYARYSLLPCFHFARCGKKSTPGKWRKEKQVADKRRNDGGGWFRSMLPLADLWDRFSPVPLFSPLSYVPFDFPTRFSSLFVIPPNSLSLLNLLCITNAIVIPWIGQSDLDFPLLPKCWITYKRFVSIIKWSIKPQFSKRKRNITDLILNSLISNFTQ